LVVRVKLITEPLAGEHCLGLEC